MDIELNSKIRKNFQGMVVKKALTTEIKTYTNLPSYVVEFLLGIYCSSDNEEAVKRGKNSVLNVISKNVCQPSLTEYIKSKIFQEGSYKVIDLVTCYLCETSGIYYLKFKNLKLSHDIPVTPDLVQQFDKIFCEGIWALVEIIKNNGFSNVEEDDSYSTSQHVNAERDLAFKSTIFRIKSIKPIEIPGIKLTTFLSARSKFTNDERLTLMLRSCGYDDSGMTRREKLHFTLRMVPLVQQNYNLVELGPRGTGKSHIYSEISPYSYLISGGNISPAKLFFNLLSDRPGLVGSYDCLAFDEIGSLDIINNETIQIMKNYMANGAYTRGTTKNIAGTSFVFIGNTHKSVSNMMNFSHLFDPFPSSIRNDSAFFDRIHAYLPGWEIPKLTTNLINLDYGLITDAISILFAKMRDLDYSTLFEPFFSLNDHFNIRDTAAVRKTFSGLAKIIYPDKNMTKEECRELLVYAIEQRRRVKEQMKIIQPGEFSKTELGFIDNETGIETIVFTKEMTTDESFSNNFSLPGILKTLGIKDGSVIALNIITKKENGFGSIIFKENNKINEEESQRFINYSNSNISAELQQKMNNGYDFNINVTSNNSDESNYINTKYIYLSNCISLFSAVFNKPVITNSIFLSDDFNEKIQVEDIYKIIDHGKNINLKNIYLPQECKLYDLPSSINGINICFYTDYTNAILIALDME